MKIGWLHDYRLSEYLGGAQLTNAGMVAGAPGWAEVVPCYPGELHEADAYVLNNVKLFTAGELARATAKPYVLFEHDYWDTPQGWQARMIRPVVEGARGVVFMSPLHLGAFLAMHHAIPRQMALCPAAMDVGAFDGLAARGDRAGTVWIGEWQEHKGVRMACEWAAQNGPVDFYGAGPETPAGPNVRACGRIEPGAVPEMLSHYERCLFLPEWCEPFGRTVAEAVLAGCQLTVAVERIGALSWGWRTGDEWRAALAGAPARFWAIVEGWL